MSASMRGLPGRRRGRGRQHSQNPLRRQRASVAGWTSTRAPLHRGQNRCKQIQSERVSRAAGSIRTRVDAQLMVQGENLQQDV
jgi:hypothetical protein